MAVTVEEGVEEGGVREGHTYLTSQWQSKVENRVDNVHERAERVFEVRRISRLNRFSDSKNR
jgi:hypothetical protein